MNCKRIIYNTRLCMFTSIIIIFCILKIFPMTNETVDRHCRRKALFSFKAALFKQQSLDTSANSIILTISCGLIFEELFLKNELIAWNSHTKMSCWIINSSAILKYPILTRWCRFVLPQMPNTTEILEKYIAKGLVFDSLSRSVVMIDRSPKK